LHMKEFKTLTFDLFGTVLDIAGSLHPFIEKFVEAKNLEIASDQLWTQWRDRQRLEQFRDTMMMLGHCGYLEVVRRALKYALDKNKIKTFSEEFDRLMLLNAFPEVEAALTRLNERFIWLCCQMVNPIT